MRQTYETEQWLPFPRNLVFAFFANPQNLPPLMPRWQKARIDEAMYCAPPLPPQGAVVFPGIVAGSGTRLKITARALPLVRLRRPWYALIEDFRWDEGFCDVQLKGPFGYWRHCHSVREGDSRNSEPGTIVRDHVIYELPLEPFSAPGRAFARMAMKSLFRYRQARAAELVRQFALSLQALP